MNQNDNRLIKKVISTDLKNISNPDFTLTTLEKIKESKKVNGLNASSQPDLTLIYPVLGFSFILILFSIIKVFCSWIGMKQVDKILNLTQSISDLLFQPSTISIIIVFTLLYYFDLYLKRDGTKFAKPN